MEKNKPILEFQLDILKKELDYVNTSIDKIDSITQSIKYWTIGIWGGAIALTLGAGDKPGQFQGQYLVTAIIPLLFWFIDAWYRRIQRSFIYRNTQISEFLNSERLKESFQRQELVGFTLLDLRGHKSRKENNYLKFTSIWRTLFFRSVFVFYLGLVLFSILITLYMELLK